MDRIILSVILILTIIINCYIFKCNKRDVDRLQQELKDLKLYSNLSELKEYINTLLKENKKEKENNIFRNIDNEELETLLNQLNKILDE